MKYALSALVLVSLISLSSLYAAAPAENSVISLSTDKDIFNSTDIVGIGRMSKVIPSPIQKLAQTVRGTEFGGRMGGRLITVMNETGSITPSSGDDYDPEAMINTEIIETESDANAGSLEIGRMYPPRLEVDFRQFPTYAAAPPEYREKQVAKMNKLIQTRFGKTVSAIDRENVIHLRGTVESERQKRVLELYVKMEPGIREVRNELTVQPLSSFP